MKELTKSEKIDVLWIRACKAAADNKRFTSIMRHFYGGQREINSVVPHSEIYHHIYHAFKRWYPDIEKEMSDIVNSAFQKESNIRFFGRLQGNETEDISFGKIMLDTLKSHVMLSQPAKYVKAYPDPAFIKNMDKYYEAKRIAREKALTKQNDMV